MTQTFLPTRPHFFFTDGGIETTLIFDNGIDLPHFAAFTLLETSEGRAALSTYFERYIPIARRAGAGFILESPTWRANADWGDRVGYSRAMLKQANADAIHMLQNLRHQHAAPATPILVSGCIGPRGDGYDAGEVMAPGMAEAYHAEQIAAFGDSGADLATAITMTNAAEAIGIARAAAKVGLPSVISFTTETDGRLPSGQALKDAILEVDGETQAAPAYYMINCAHPTHFESSLEEGAAWTRRIGGLRANASCKSHAELDASPCLDRGDPADLASRYAALVRRHPSIRVIGGCCGTSHKHISAIQEAIAADASTSEASI